MFKKLFIFLFINVLFSSLLSIKFFLVPGASLNIEAIAFAFLAVPSQFFLIYLLLTLICSVIFLKIIPIPKLIKNTVVGLIFGLAQVLLFIDIITFQQYRFHINQSVLSLVFSGQVVDFSLTTYLTITAIVLMIVFVEILILCVIDKKIQKSPFSKIFNRIINCIILVFLLILVVSNLSYMVASYYGYSAIMTVKEYIPYYQPLTSHKIMNFIDKDGENKIGENNINFNGNVDYPKKSLEFSPKIKPTNIIFILLDSWRYDAFNEETSPNTYQFVKRHDGIIFNHHYSTGNATRAGIFGLFYGIPATYWQSFYNSKIPSLFIKTLQKQNYDIGVFTSAKVTSPEFDQTVFATIQNLRIGSKGNDAAERDRSLTNDWIDWFKNRDSSKPSFSFLFYDGPHAYESLKELKPKFKPFEAIDYLKLTNESDPLPIMNLYKNSVYSDDYLLKNIYDELEKSGALDNTLVVITGDHGQEINDNKLNYWGHNGNYTDAQTKVPFIIIGAKDIFKSQLEENAKNNVLTSHADVVPSLMKHYLGVNNDIGDYSTGYDLFSPIHDRDWLLISSYSTYGVRTQKNIYYINSIGLSSYMDEHNKVIDEKPDFNYVKKAYDDMSHFHK